MGGRAEKEDTGIARTLDMVDLSAVDLVIATVIKVVVITHQTDGVSPFKEALSAPQHRCSLPV